MKLKFNALGCHAKRTSSKLRNNKKKCVLPSQRLHRIRFIGMLLFTLSMSFTSSIVEVLFSLLSHQKITNESNKRIIICHKITTHTIHSIDENIYINIEKFERA